MLAHILGARQLQGEEEPKLTMCGSRMGIYEHRKICSSALFLSLDFETAKTCWYYKQILVTCTTPGTKLM